MEPLTSASFIVEVLDHHGHVQARVRMPLVEGCGSATVGRGIAADILIDDIHAAPLHARIDVDAAGIARVSDLGSLNGLVIGGRHVREARQVELTDRLLQIGRTRLRVRTAAEQLAPEKPIESPSVMLMHHAGGVTTIGILLFFLYGTYTQWLSAPRDLLAGLVTFVSLAALGSAVWVGGWALLSRILSGEWRWLRHSAVLFGTLSLAILIDELLDLGWFALLLPVWENRDGLFGMASFSLLLYGHLVVVGSLPRRRTILLSLILPVLIVGSAMWVKIRGDARNVNHIAKDEMLYPPAVRLREGISIDAFFTRAAGLGEVAIARRKAMAASDEAEEGDDND